MKIVGTTDKGFLAQVTLDEIALILGFGQYALHSERKQEFKDAIGLDERHNIKTGTEIKITTGFQYIAELRDKQTTAKSCASTLREIADLITSGLPETVIPGGDKSL